MNNISDLELFKRIKLAAETNSTLDEVNYYYDVYLPSIYDEIMEYESQIEKEYFEYYESLDNNYE